MLGYGATETMMCRLFPGSLVKKANKWFNRLPPRSIHNFISGLQVSEFYQYIKRKNIMDLAHFRKKAEEWIAIKEACMAKKDDLNAATQQPPA
jgi:hypothetical protein